MACLFNDACYAQDMVMSLQLQRTTDTLTCSCNELCQLDLIA